jgi:hypothetical protein
VQKGREWLNSATFNTSVNRLFAGDQERTPSAERQGGHLMSQSEQIKFERSEGGKIPDDTDNGIAGTRKSLGLLHVSEF